MGSTNKERYTEKQVIKALALSDGYVTKAAERLGCHYTTVSRFIEKHPAIVKQVEHFKEAKLDLAESELSKQIKKGNLDAVKFFLLHRGQSRDYRKEMRIELTDDLSELMKNADKRTKE